MDPNTPHTKNPFATFALNPLGITFDSQETGEEIILLLRAHVITLLPTIVFIGILIALPAVALAVLNFFNIPLTGFFTPIQVLLILVFWYLFVFAFSLYKFIFWYFNVYILTNERVIDFDFRGILHKRTSFAKLNQIQDVTPKMLGFFSTFFNYGDIYIQTAGERQEFEFHKTPRPDEVSNRILEEIRKEEGETPGEIK